jgi:hypothetical protein
MKPVDGKRTLKRTLNGVQLIFPIDNQSTGKTSSKNRRVKKQRL